MFLNSDSSLLFVPDGQNYGQGPMSLRKLRGRTEVRLSHECDVKPASGERETEASGSGLAGCLRSVAG